MDEELEIKSEETYSDEKLVKMTKQDMINFCKTLNEKYVNVKNDYLDLYERYKTNINILEQEIKEKEKLTNISKSYEEGINLPFFKIVRKV